MNKKAYLELSEKRWGLYDFIPQNDISLVFSFIDQLITGGHYNSQIVFDNAKAINNTVININLNPRVSEETIVHVINHEFLHHSLHNCLLKKFNTPFVENVIDEWMLKQKTVQEGWKGKITIQKLKEDV